MILLFNHTLTSAQKKDAQTSLGVERFTALPPELQEIWSHIPPEIQTLKSILKPIKEFVSQTSTKNKYILIQGDFGATYEMVNFSKSLGLIPVYATTKREVLEIQKDHKIFKESIFKHIMFRKYEG